MAKHRELYDALGVSPDAKHEDIRSAYRKLARKHHPDVNPGDPSADDRFKKIASAYDVLGDDAKRKIYDEFGMEGLAPGFDPERAREYERWREQAERSGGRRGGVRFSGDWADLSDIMGDVFGGGGGFHVDPEAWGGGARGTGPRGARPSAGQDVEAALDLDLLDAVRGFTTTLVLSGVDPATGAPTRREIRVKVPAGAETGRRIRLRGQGEPGARGAPAGDLYVVPNVRPHPLVTREGNDLIMDLPVTVAEAVRGAKVGVPVPTGGTIQVRVPKGTQSGQRLRVKGKGVPAHGSRPAGDLYLRAMIRVPESPDAETEAAAERLEAAYGSDPRRGLVFP